MTEKTKMKLILMIMIINAAVLIGASEVSGQERIDDWYGQEFTELHAQLRDDAYKYGSYVKHVDDGDRESLFMKDYRGVKCEYISLDNGYTVRYRVDHYSRKQYNERLREIKENWTNVGGYYILRNTVVAMFDHKHHRIGFALRRDLERNGYDLYDGKPNLHPIFTK